MPKIDLYKVFQLDPRQSPTELATQLDRQLAATDPANQTLHQQIAAAKVILGDPRRRARYDAELADPNARLDATDIDRIAGVKTGRSAAGLTPTQRALAIVASVTVLALIVGVGLVVALTGSHDDGSGSAARHQSGSETDDPLFKRENLEKMRLTTLDSADWSDANPATGPMSSVHLNAAFDLPQEIVGAMNGGGAQTRSFNLGIVQFQDKTVGVRITVDHQLPGTSYRREYLLVTYGQDGRLVSSRSYADESAMPAQFDLAKQSDGPGYYRVTAADGISIPTAANGTQPEMNYALVIKQDAFDAKLFWVLLRGSNKLYKADVRFTQAHIDDVAVN